MAIISATVQNKILTLDDTCIICNNSDYDMVFTFDEPFLALRNLKCRFIFNGTYIDVPIIYKKCSVPVISKANEVKVGIYCGEGKESCLATTYAVIKCKQSIKCVTPT